MDPSGEPYAWDNKEIYRSSFLYLNGIYSVFYSAMDTSNKWHIGLTEGKTMTQLKGYDVPAPKPNELQSCTTTITLAEIVAGGKIIVHGRTGKRIRILKYFAKSIGDFSGGGGTGLVLQDTSISPTVVVTIAKAALTDGAKISSDLTIVGVTDGAGFTGQDLIIDKPLAVKADALVSGGTSVYVAIDYMYV